MKCEKCGDSISVLFDSNQPFIDKKTGEITIEKKKICTNCLFGKKKEK